MTRILIQRGSSGSSSSSSQNRSSTTTSSSSSTQQLGTSHSQFSAAFTDASPVEKVHEQISTEIQDNLGVHDENNEEIKSEDPSLKSVNNFHDEGKHIGEGEKSHGDLLDSGSSIGGFGFLEEKDDTAESSIGMMTGTSYPPPPPVPPPKPVSLNSTSRRFSSPDPIALRSGSSRRAPVWPGGYIRSSPTASLPSSPHSHCEGEGYNSSDEQGQCFSSSYDDAERERHFELELRRVKGLEVRRMLEDGNCLFRAVGDQVYGDSEAYELVRQMCIDYMEHERDHFSQFITEGFTSYCKRKRRDKVYGNNVEIQALSEMYNRPIHIYSYSTDPINIFHGSYHTDSPPIRLSYHHGNHYNSLVDPRRPNIGAGLGFSSLQRGNVDRDQVKAAIKAQQDQQIDNALLAEGRFYSDLELTEKEIERTVLEASRAEYLAENKPKQETSTSRAEPSSSAVSETRREGWGVSSSVQMMLSMGFGYVEVMEAHRIFGDDVDAMVVYLVEASNRGRWKGKAAE